MIPLVKLHHVSFASRSLSASRAFFGGVLGLPEIPRPAFRFPGAWYAIGDRQLHIIENTGPEAHGPASRLSRSDHLALEVTDVEAVCRTLEAHGIPYQVGENRDLRMRQIFCHDPDGHVIEFARYE